MSRISVSVRHKKRLSARLSETCIESLWVGLSLWVGTSDLPTYPKGILPRYRLSGSYLSADQRSGDFWLHKQTHVPLRAVLRAPCADSRSRISCRYARTLRCLWAHSRRLTLVSTRPWTAGSAPRGLAHSSYAPRLGRRSARAASPGQTAGPTSGRTGRGSAERSVRRSADYVGWPLLMRSARRSSLALCRRHHLELR